MRRVRVVTGSIDSTVRHFLLCSCLSRALVAVTAAMLAAGCGAGLERFVGGELGQVSPDAAAVSPETRRIRVPGANGALSSEALDGGSGDFQELSISVVRGEVEWILGEVMKGIGDEFVLVEGEAEEEEAEEEEGEHGKVRTMVTASVVLRTREDARRWVREMLRSSGYQWSVVGGRWWISDTGLGGDWVYIGSYGAWRVAQSLDVSCIGSWCRMHGEEAELLVRLAVPADQVVYLSGLDLGALADFEGVVNGVEVDGGTVVWGPTWAISFLESLIAVGACVGFRLDASPASGFIELLDGWAEQCGRSRGPAGRVVWVPVDESPDEVLNVVGAIGTWLLIGRVWSTSLAGSAGLGDLRDPLRLFGIDGDETEGSYLARIPWGPGQVAMQETTTWRVRGSDVTVEEGVVVSESGTDSVRTGIEWEGVASHTGLTGWVRWTEGSRGDDETVNLQCEGEVRLRRASGWQPVCAVTGRSVGGRIQLPFGVHGVARERRYQVEVRAALYGADAGARSGEWGRLWRLLRGAYAAGVEWSRGAFR